MNARDPLAQLRDIHLPPPLGWWPPAPGWWLLALIVAAGLFGVIFWLRRFRRGNYRRAARRELRRLRENPQGLTDHQLLTAVAALVRRVALASCGRARVASLSGEAWLTFLDQTGKTDQFSTGPGRVLGADLYRPESAVDVEALLGLVEKWLRRHKPC